MLGRAPVKRDRLEKKRGGETKEVAIREVAVRKKSSIEPCEPAVSVADRRLVGILYVTSACCFYVRRWYLLIGYG